jgi:hypothetical protein
MRPAGKSAEMAVKNQQQPAARVIAHSVYFAVYIGQGKFKSGFTHEAVSFPVG